MTPCGPLVEAAGPHWGRGSAPSGARPGAGPPQCDCLPKVGGDAVVRQEYLADARRLVIKIGTRVVTRRPHGLNTAFLHDLASQCATLQQQGGELVVVTSGAVHLGRQALNLVAHGGADSVALRQAAAAVGQVELMRQYREAFASYDLLTAQVLLTPGDIADRQRYLYLRGALQALLEQRAVPIVNENDSVSVAGVTFGENDKLAALIAAKVHADLLIFLSDQEGLFTADPRAEPTAELIPVVTPGDDWVRRCAQEAGGPESSGGMLKKLQAARTVAECGIPAVMANGLVPGMVLRLLSGEPVGTFFVPAPRLSSRKSWIASATEPAGVVLVDDGARRALLSPDGSSLLPSGIIGVDGEFAAGDAVVVRDQQGREIARGLCNYSAAEVRRIQGAQSRDIEQLLGHIGQDEVMHRDNMVVSAR